MKVEVPVIVKDPEVSEWKGVSPTEVVTIETEDHFLAGPIAPRVAVLDFDPATGNLEPGVSFTLSEDGESGAFAIEHPILPGEVGVGREAGAVSVFGTIFKTLALFEEEDALGRPVSWSFGAPQLLVIPRAGDWPNAFYERESQSIQFFFFRPEGREDKVIHTGHSQDIVAHETAHAIVDGVAPDLYHSITPQSLAIHEAVADLTALLCSFRSEELARTVLEQTGGSLTDSNAFTGIAEEFAGGLDRQRHYLRQLNNDKSLKGATSVDSSDPHDLSEVFSGALYRVLVKIYDELRQHYDQGVEPTPELAASGEAEFSMGKVRQYSVDKTASIGSAMKALFVAGERLKRTLFRGLDYLPPGDITFADFGRAIIAADQASHPESESQREWLIDEFLRRNVVGARQDLDVPVDVSNQPLRNLDLNDLVDSDWVAYDFVNRNRKLFGIPDDTTFEVRPRLPVTRLYWHRDGKVEVDEVLLKVGWTEEEGHRIPGLPSRRAVARGATLSLEAPPGRRDQARIRTIVTSGPLQQSRSDRTQFVRRLHEDGELLVGDEADGPDGRRLRNVVPGEVLHGTLRVRGTSRTLHLTREAL